MTLTDVMDIAVSGLVAQRARLTVTASNLANAQTTRTPEGGAYVRRDPVFTTRSTAGPFANALDRAIRAVKVDRVQLDPREPISRHQPGHPDADELGNVQYPNVNVVEEITNLTSAQRSFEANLLIMRKVRQMAEAVAQLGR